MRPAIETTRLTRTFGDFVAVDGLSIQVPVGKIYGFLGLNGAGKSTTIRMLTTLLPPSSGEARVLGHDVAAEPLAVRRVIGLVGEEAGESRPSWSATEYLGYFARIRGARDAANEVERALTAVGLDQRARQRAMGTYSTGMKRRVEIARALLGSPRVLFLDEPSRGLDLPAKRDLWALLRKLAAEEGTTIFLSSHDAREIHELCEDLSILAQGRLTYCGPTQELGRELPRFEDALIRLLDRPRPPSDQLPSAP